MQPIFPFSQDAETYVLGKSYTGVMRKCLSCERVNQGGRSWRASGDRQISLNASAERAFTNFRDKKHRILQLQFFATKTLFFCASADSPASKSRQN